MFFAKPLSTSTDHVERINNRLRKLDKGLLSKKQLSWMALCLTGIVITDSVCWKKFERASFGTFQSSAISKMFRRFNHNWKDILQASTMEIFSEYGITSGTLAIDDTGNKRSKKTPKIAKTHKIKDKATNGYINGQQLVFLVLITDKITIPVGFVFYEPDPIYRDWKKNDKILRKKGVAKKKRPPEPKRDPKYPTMPQLALELIQEFKKNYPQIKIDSVLADALYGTSKFMDTASKILGGCQVISQIRSNQIVNVRGKNIPISEYCNRAGNARYYNLKIRGGKTVRAKIVEARLHVKSHGRKRSIIALKYPGEEEYRYIVATDLTWMLTDVITAYTLRWLVEVFIQDWKSDEGWTNLAKQPGDKGSYQGVSLSLLCDHMFLLHPDQIALIKSKLPATTVGSLRDRERGHAMIEFMEYLINHDDADRLIQELKESMDNVMPFRESSKHMNTRNLGNQRPSESLKRRFAA